MGNVNKMFLVFLKTFLLVGVAFGDPSGTQPSGTRPKPPYKVLFSNDTTNTLTCVSPYHAKGQGFSPEMLKATVDEVAGVDVHMLQPGLGWIPWWKSREYPADEHYRWFEQQTGIKPDTWGQYIIDGGDLVQVFVDRCRKQGQAPFVSLRLNDGHHLENAGKKSRHAVFCSRMYVEHPEWRLGTNPESWDERVWNWAIPEVRDHKLAFIEEICEQYDIDGFELDFLRHDRLFDVDATTSEQREAIVTGFVRRVREVLDRTAHDGRRRWLCVRVPCFLVGHDPLGIDLPAMVEAGVDMVNLSSYFFTTQQTDLARIRTMVPDAAVYLEMTHATMNGPSQGGYDSFTYRRTKDQQFYTGAHLAYERGADGVSLFNFVYYREHGRGEGRGPFDEPPFHVLAGLGQPDWLAGQPQWYVLAHNWYPRNAEGRPMPQSFNAGTRHGFTLDLAPPQARPAGLFRLMTCENYGQCAWKVAFNGKDLESSPCVARPIEYRYQAQFAAPEQYACFIVPAGTVLGGDNQIEITLMQAEQEKVLLDYMDLVLPWPAGARLAD